MPPSSAARRRDDPITDDGGQHSPAPAGSPPRRSGRRLTPAVADAFFEPQPTLRSALPDPEPLARNLARSVVEILAGAREIEQITRWVTADVFTHLLKRVNLAARARSARGEAAQRPAVSVGSVRIDEPCDGVVEAVVVVHGRARSRAVALRLEGFDHRWRATAIHVL
ncbi:Rv3235 family protein [Frondihabitans sp. Leaf304]|uniref:Rv3235 family protein n=1 Tax=Frondihabitans sp. Leaf304 TaxID=1736329 RepID=UPI000B2BACE5|nr:Rv3235 family protein [Frondihabitans sp. Leaf304]